MFAFYVKQEQTRIKTSRKVNKTSKLKLIIQIWIEYSPYKRDLITLNKEVINYMPRCTYLNLLD